MADSSTYNIHCQTEGQKHWPLQSINKVSGQLTTIWKTTVYTSAVLLVRQQPRPACRSHSEQLLKGNTGARGAPSTAIYLKIRNLGNR